MPLNTTQDTLASVSSLVQKSLLRGEVADTFTTSLGDVWIDPLSPGIMDILDAAMANLQQYTYVGGKPITTVSSELYGTTSAWWIILYCNGYMHPDEISDGVTLKVPSSLVIENLVRATVVNNRGKSITT